MASRSRKQVRQHLSPRARQGISPINAAAAGGIIRHVDDVWGLFDDCIPRSRDRVSGLADVLRHNRRLGPNGRRDKSRPLFPVPTSQKNFGGGLRWWAVTGSNRRPSRCKRDALPAELTARSAGSIANDGQRASPQTVAGRPQNLRPARVRQELKACSSLRRL